MNPPASACSSQLADAAEEVGKPVTRPTGQSGCQRSHKVGTFFEGGGQVKVTEKSGSFSVSVGFENKKITGSLT